MDNVAVLANIFHLPQSQVQQILRVNQILSVTGYLNSLDEDQNAELSVPGFGKVYTDKNLRMEFVPEPALKKDLATVLTSPNTYLKTQIKSILLQKGE